MIEIAEGPVLARAEERTLLVTLNRPDQRNALNEDVLVRLRDVAAAAADDPDVRAVVITGSGDRAFCAGADIRQMQAMDSRAAREWALLGHDVFRRLSELPKPVIAAINGVAAGGGCELALACDFRFMAEGAQIGQPEIKLGLIPGWGGTQRLPRLVGDALAKDLIFTGRLMGSEEARRVGLVNGVTPPSAVAQQALVYATQFAQLPPLAVAYAKEAIAAAQNKPLRESGLFEVEQFARTFETEDRTEGLAAFLEKRPARFTGK